MAKVKIIVEGTTDKALVNNILQNEGKKEKIDYEFLGLKGLDSVLKTLKSLTPKDMQDNIYFAIVDADKSFSKRNTQMQELTKKQIDYFIFPNNQDNGNLETLLLDQIEDKVIDCFEEYENCIDKELDKKAKLYAYTTVKLNKRPEDYILNLELNDNFNELKEKLINLFKEE